MVSRIQRLRRRFLAAGVDSLLVTSAPNVRYLSGFSGSSGALLVGAREATLFTDSRYTLQAGEESHDVDVRTVAGNPARSALEAMPASRIGFEADDLTVAEHDHLSSGFHEGRLLPVRGHVEALRATKEPDEVAAIEASLEVTAGSFLRGVERARPGATELQVAAAIEGAMREGGATGPAFESIVASGPRGALPHGRATGRKLQRGDPLVIDIGAMLEGYASDMTRTVFVEEVSDRGREVYGAVLAAVKRAESEVRDGVPASHVDDVTRKTLADAGFEEHAYGHGTGHGVGLLVHEDPRVARGRTEPLREGMVLTIEPGVYIPGWGGVRIEDIVLVEKDGCRLLTTTPKDLLTV